MVSQVQIGSSANTFSTSMTRAPASARADTARSHTARTSASSGAYPSVGDHATAIGTWGRSRAPAQDGSGMGNERRSVGSGPRTASRACATLTAVRAIGPLLDRLGHPGGCGPPTGTRPSDALIPDRPHSAEGMRIDPPPSDPVANGTMPEAMAAALPPDDPPGERARSHGLRVDPKSGDSVSAFHPSSGVLVLPTTTHPAATRRSTSGEWVVAGAPAAHAADPNVVRKPAASSRSLTPMGMPASGP